MRSMMLRSTTRSMLLAISAAGLVTSLGTSAQAAIAIAVDKNNQQMTVAVDGVTRYTWPVSSGNPSHETPNGSFRTFRMEEDHYSKEFDDAPMPHAIFFTKQGHAIHGTDSISRLGSPASHGCVRLSRENASTLWDLVKADGVLNTTVTLTGSSTVALARNPRPRSNVATTRGNDATTEPSIDVSQPAGQPLPVAPQRRVAQPNYGTTYGDVRYPDGSPARPYDQQDRTTYGEQRGPTQPQPQRRVYSEPRGVEGYDNQRNYQGGYYEQDARYQRPQYYAPRRGYYVYGY